ncbi:MAG: hypothetical protein JXQ73_00210 [Phycisphaerae bacterium]|nr:hypothetical protein [Phycisphaerae bacterium]
MAWACLPLTGLGVFLTGCSSTAKAPPFEWWVDPLPAPPPAAWPRHVTPIAVLVEHTGRRDDFRTFERDVRHKNGRVQRGEIPGFRAECHFLPKLPGTLRDELEAGLRQTGWFLPVKRRDLDKALKQVRAQWLDLRNPSVAAQVGRLCEVELVLLVEIVDCTMNVIEARRQTLATDKVGPTRRTDVTIDYDIRVVDVAKGRIAWRSGLTRRTGYKLEGPGSMGHWYWPRDPLEFRKALRGQGITEYVLRAFLEPSPDRNAPMQNPSEPWRTW